MSTDGRLAIVSALGEELRALRRSVLRRNRVRSPSRLDLESGTLNGSAVLLATVGDGAAAAADGLAWVLEHHPVETVLIVGLGGGLDSELNIGTVVFADEVRDTLGATVHASEPWKRRAAAVSLRREVVVSVPRLAGTASQKRLLREGDVGRAPAVVDLESWALATLASRAGCSWVVLRAVSDLPSEAIPDPILLSQDHGGAVQRHAVVVRALLQPRTVPQLWELRVRTRRCAEQLARQTQRLIASGP